MQEASSTALDERHQRTHHRALGDLEHGGTEGRDGYVSLEVSLQLAHVTDRTIAEARRLFEQVGRPNVMIKVPATPEGIPAIERLIGGGVNINITLIFSRETYAQVAEAYLAGLKRRASDGQPIDQVASVASVFVSRIDTALDNLLEAHIRASDDPRAQGTLRDLLGKAAIANAKLIYAAFKETFRSPRFMALQRAGVRVQRPLWASTGTKNPHFSDVYYVEALIGPDTVDTIPPATLAACSR